ncbi:hypothetical protein AGMMS49982_03920 [Bacteroidia bacterium]|nr:hypothetical protein AGMMS49982_03920 [Bacteroidia bacterium]
MQYIDKTKVEIKNQAYDLLSSFIEGQWQEEDCRYVNLTYEDFRNDALRDLLLEEQHHYCCYCMKRILNKETTLEHIVPNKSDDTTLIDKYIPYGEIEDSVFFWERKKTYSTKFVMPPFPHILAYENLVASCNGHIPEGGVGKHCNNARGNQDIIPLFYIEDIHKEIVYEPNGTIKCGAEYFPTIKALNLEHATLQLFRRCWLNLPSKYTDRDVEKASKDENLRNEIIDDMDSGHIALSDRTTMQNTVYWSSFVNYFWFYFYKKENE